MIAHALIEYLAENFEVTVTKGSFDSSGFDAAGSVDSTDGPDNSGSAQHPVQTITLTPSQALAASIRFTFNSNYTLSVQYGLLHEFPYPVCACDACDEVWENWSDALESQVFAVVNGHFRERVDAPEPGWLEHSFGYRDFGGSFNFSADVRPGFVERVSAAKPTLATVTSGWKSWVFRADEDLESALFQSS